MFRSIVRDRRLVHKLFLLLGGSFICAYALAVLWHVYFLPDIGLRFAFKTALSEVLPSYQRSNPEWLADPTHAPDASLPLPLAPQKGDRIIELAGTRIGSWPQLLNTLAQLQTARERSESRPPPQTYRRVGDEEWVYCQFQHLDGTPDRALRYGCWFCVGHLPVRDLVPSIAWFFLKIGLFAVGALVFWKRPSDDAAAQFFLLCIVTVGAYMGGYHWTRIATHPALLTVFIICGVLLPPTSLHFYLLFPRRKSWFPARSIRAGLLLYGIPLLFLAVILASYWHIRLLVRGGAPNGQVSASWDVLGVEVIAYLVLAAALYFGCVVSLLDSYRRARNLVEANQVKWILGGAALALLPIGYTLYLVVCQREALSAGKGAWPMFAASVCFTTAFTISITRYRLLELDQLLSAGAIYFVISLVAGAIYYAVTFACMLAATLLGSPAGLEWNSLAQALWVSTTALILMLLFNFGRQRVKRALDRRFSRNKHQLDRTFRRMGDEIARLVDAPTLGQHLLQACAELLGVSSGAVFVRTPAGTAYRLAASHGQPPALSELPQNSPVVSCLQHHNVLLVPDSSAPADRQLQLLGGVLACALRAEQELSAFLVLGPKSLGRFEPDDLNLLAALAQIAAIALQSAQRHGRIEELTQDLRAKVEKISEQQRRIVTLQTQLTQAPGSTNDVVNGTLAPQTPSLSGAAADPFASSVGNSPRLREVVDLARKASRTSSAVLIRGESGSGKELLARAIHQESGRAVAPFVKVHCAALSPGLLESELFGHVKGAFTSAHRNRVGRFELANGGTVFLDEVGDLSLEIQTKLLQVLQDKSFERVGSSDPVRVDVRVIAATHQNLEEAIRQGRFREDLYYRLRVIELTLPPLRERVEDIPELTLHFLHRAREKEERGPRWIDDDALVALKNYSWPGNIRELENVILRAVVVAEGPQLGLADLPDEIVRSCSIRSADQHVVAAPVGKGIHRERQERAALERQRLLQALAAANGNKAEAARALGLARSTFLSRLKKLGLS